MRRIAGVRAAGVVLAVALTAGVSGCAREKSPAEVAQEAADFREAMSSTIHIYLDGSASSADVTMQVGDEGMRQFTTDVPMINKAGASGLEYTLLSGDSVYFSAQMQSEFGDLRCRIVDRNGVLKESSSSVSYGIVTCAATIP